MAASYVQILKSSDTYQAFFRETYEIPQIAASMSWPLVMFNNPYVAGDAVPITRKIKIHGSEF